MNTKSIRFRLTVWYAGFLAGILLIIGVSGYLGLRWYLNRAMEDNLNRRANLVGERLVKNIPEMGEAYVGSEIDTRWVPSAFGRFFRVTRRDGKVLYQAAPPQDGHFDPAAIPAPNLNLEAPGFRQVHPASGDSLTIFTLPYQISTGEIYFIESGVSDRENRRVLRWLLISFGCGFPFLLVTGSLGAYVLVRNALRPVDLMTLGARRITASNLGRRLLVPRNDDEIERLGNSLNDMIERLEIAFQQVSRFTGDASHELRTPLTVLRGELEAMRHSASLSPAEQDIIESAIDETDRLTQIVTSLLAIARFDAGEARLERTLLDLGELVASTVDQIKLLAEDSDLKLMAEVQTGIMISGDRSRLKQILVNLLDNAIRYTPAGGTISVQVTGDDKNAILEVRDTGIGIPPAAIPHVFDRFFRVQHVRTNQVHGTGLGLSIVKSICSAHDATISVKSEEGRGTTFRIDFPRPNRISSSNDLSQAAEEQITGGFERLSGEVKPVQIKPSETPATL